MEASRGSVRDTEGVAKERNPQPTPSGGNGGQGRNVHPIPPPTAQSTETSRPAPALKPKPASLRSRQDGSTNSETSRRHANDHGAPPRKGRSEVSSNEGRDGVRGGERTGSSDSTRRRQGEGGASPSLKHPVIKSNTPKQPAIAQQQHHHPTPVTGDSLGSLPQLPVFVSDKGKTHSGEPRQRMDARKRPSQPLTPANPDLARSSDLVIEKMLRELEQKAADNDYYQLLGVVPGASSSELSQARRKKARQVHPDHYGDDPERQRKVQPQMTLINQVYQDVLKDQDTRSLYDQLCQFRQNYVQIPNQKQRGLETAHTKLQTLHKQMKRNRLPLALLSELELALKLITTCLEKVT